VAKQAVVILIVVAAFGVLVPLYKGFGFLDSRIIAAYACLALLFVAPASAELVGAHGKSAPSTAILARIGLIVAWGWGMSLVILATAIVTLNLLAGGGRGWLVPPADYLSAILTFSLSASIAIAILGAVLASRFSATGVKNILRTGFLAILLLMIFGSRLLPESAQLQVLDHFNTRRAITSLAWESSVVCAVVAALLLVVLFAKIPKTENPAEGGG
jgi:hypothetical protein